MVESRPLTIDDFIEIGYANAEKYPEFVKLPVESQQELALLNIKTGEAKSHFINGKLSGMSGMRFIGIGEIWGLCLPEIRCDKKFTLYRHTKKEFEKTRDELGLWRVYAENTLSENFLKHLDFDKTTNIFQWTRRGA